MCCSVAAAPAHKVEGRIVRGHTHFTVGVEKHTHSTVGVEGHTHSKVGVEGHTHSSVAVEGHTHSSVVVEGQSLHSGSGDTPTPQQDPLHPFLHIMNVGVHNVPLIHSQSHHHTI